MKGRHISLFVILILVLMGCRGETPVPPAATATVQPPDPTSPPEETAVLTEQAGTLAQPTDAPVEPTATEPAGAGSGSFRDDFETGPDGSWTWINEDTARWRITEGRLEITADDPPIAAETPDIPMVNLLTRPIPQGIDVVLTTYVSVDPDENFEQAALFLIEDGDSYVLVNVGFCGFCGGKGVYLETASDGQPLLEGLQVSLLPEDVTGVWLRLEYSPEAGVVVALFAVEEGAWQRVGEIVRSAPAFTLAGLGAANLPGPESNPEEDLVALYDFFELAVFD